MINSQFNIIPYPAQLAALEGMCDLADISQCILDEQLKHTPAVLHQCLTTVFGKELPITINGKSDHRPPGSIQLILNQHQKTLGNEGYNLVINENNILLQAYSEAGLFYGCQTLIQLAQNHPDFQTDGKQLLSCLVITDVPRFPWRGFMLDSARHYQTPDFIKQFIDEMAKLKLNRLHWHFIDNESWRLQLECKPELVEHNDEIGNIPGSYSHNEIRDIISYAAQRHIVVYPEIEIPGHNQHALAMMPELACAGAKPVIREVCLGNPKSEEFFKKVLAETIALFPTPYIHIGGDEALNDNWKACPRCQEKVSTLGLLETRDLQHYFMGIMSDYVHQKGKQSIAWAENLDRGIPADQIVQGWHENESASAISKGAYTINSEHAYVYFDYPQDDDDIQSDWMPMLPIKKTYAFDPIPAGTQEKDQHLVLGSEACLWTENVPQESVMKKTFPRLCAFAETVWTPKLKQEFSSFMARLKFCAPN